MTSCGSMNYFFIFVFLTGIDQTKGGILDYLKMNQWIEAMKAKHLTENITLYGYKDYKHISECTLSKWCTDKKCGSNFLCCIKRDIEKQRNTTKIININDTLCQAMVNVSTYQFRCFLAKELTTINNQWDLTEECFGYEKVCQLSSSLTNDWVWETQQTTQHTKTSPQMVTSATVPQIKTVESSATTKVTSQVSSTTDRETQQTTQHTKTSPQMVTSATVPQIKTVESSATTKVTSQVSSTTDRETQQTTQHTKTSPQMVTSATVPQIKTVESSATTKVTSQVSSTTGSTTSAPTSATFQQSSTATTLEEIDISNMLSKHSANISNSTNNFQYTGIHLDLPYDPKDSLLVLSVSLNVILLVMFPLYVYHKERQDKKQLPLQLSDYTNWSDERNDNAQRPGECEALNQDNKSQGTN
ncbi:uncharacterized protein ACNS7B_009546 [Menidia menidia]